MGRVTVAIISFGGMMPLFTMTTTRGKLVCGKTDDGVRRAEKTPARHRVTAINVIEIAWRVANRPRLEDFPELIAPPPSWLQNFAPPVR